MMQDVNTLAALLMFPSVVSLFHVWSAAHSLYALGKSKTKLKKLDRTINLWQRLLLIYPLERETSQYGKIIFLRRMYYLMLVVFFLCIFMLIFAAIFPSTNNVFSYCIVGKFIIIDIPIWIVAFVMSKHGKNGGVVWRWEK